MKRSTVARIISIVLIAYGLALLLVTNNAHEMETYRTLSRDALLAELTSSHSIGFDGMFIGCIVILGVVVPSANALSRLIAAIIDRISPPLPPIADLTDELTDEEIRSRVS